MERRQGGGRPADRLGRLRVQGVDLVDRDGRPVQLAGMSSHGLQWFGRYVNHGSIAWLRDDWGCSLFRAAMYVEEGGYAANPEVKERVVEAVEAAIDLGIYVIIDWHILHDRDPLKHMDKAKAFFAEMAAAFGRYPHVLYEICNEPNGRDVTWQGNIKPYAEEIIPVIRESAPDSIVLVGTGTWSQDVHHAADDPLDFDNIMYTVHFYAGTHGQYLRDRIDYARGRGAPVFVTEWGTSEASGDGGVFIKESLDWLDFMAERNISWANWSLADKAESSAALAAGIDHRPDGGWPPGTLSESGRFVRDQLRRMAGLEGRQ